MNCSVNLKMPGFADCDIKIRAKGFLVATVYWANETGSLPGWSAFAVFPIEPTGIGHYYFHGHRAIPDKATHLYIKCVSASFEIVESCLLQIPGEYLPHVAYSKEPIVFSLMSDLHLSNNPRKILQALRKANSTILISGDLTNDGISRQFELLKECIDTVAKDRLILAVTGNHDQLLQLNAEESFGYNLFQKSLFDRAETLGFHVEIDNSGAYSVSYESIDIIGLQCVTVGRKFIFPEGKQLKWLKQHLDSDTSTWHIVLCHAPLSEHTCRKGKKIFYLSRNDELQQIIDQHQNIIFISGHTHFSPNIDWGTVQCNPLKNIIYIDDGSICPTDLQNELLVPTEWKDGVIAELKIFSNAIEVSFKSIKTGVLYPRGYYRFSSLK